MWRELSHVLPFTEWTRKMLQSDLSLNERACAAYTHKTTKRSIQCNAHNYFKYAFMFNYKSDYSAFTIT